MRPFLLLCLGLCFILTGCGGGNEPINEGKDRPIPTPKDLGKDKK